MRKTNTLFCLEKMKPILSIALKQTKARPRSSGTPVLVTYVKWSNFSNIQHNSAKFVLNE